jgi:transposase
MKDQRTYFVGIDLHKEYSTVTVLDEAGNEMDQRNLPNNVEDFTLYFRQWEGKIRAALEATYNWYWLVDLLQRLGVEVKLANPYKTRIIGEARVKTDKIDSRILAQLLRADFLPTSFIADPKTRDDREWLRYRIYLVRLQTSVKTRIHCLIDKYNIQHDFSDLFSKPGIEFLKTLSLPERTSKCLEGLLHTLEFLQEELRPIRNEIIASVKEDEEAKLLETIPGIGYFSALLFLKEIGTIERFSSAKKLAAYSGLVPGISSSGGKTHMRGITKQGNKYLRWILIQAASSIVRTKKDRRLMSLYSRVQHRKNSKVAKTAVAKEILTLAYFILKNRAPYDPMRLYQNTDRRAILTGV